MLKRLALLSLFLATPAAAQQQQLSPPETALQINGILGTWAQTLVQQGRVIEELQKQLAAEKAKSSPSESPKSGHPH